MDNQLSITITRQSGFQFLVDFGVAESQLTTDEPAPLGHDAGPGPKHLLMAAVANCLSASLVFALGKFKQDPGPLKARATATTGRNENNRLRIQTISVQLELQKPAAELEHLDRVLAQFEDFCTVSMSVQQGIEIDVTVADVNGVVLKS